MGRPEFTPASASPTTAPPAGKACSVPGIRREQGITPLDDALLQCFRPRAFSSEVDTGSREEDASKQESRASVLIQSETKMLWTSPRSQGGSGANWPARKSMKARTFAGG